MFGYYCVVRIVRNSNRKTNNKIGGISEFFDLKLSVTRVSDKSRHSVNSLVLKLVMRVKRKFVSEGRII